MSERFCLGALQSGHIKEVEATQGGSITRPQFDGSDAGFGQEGASADQPFATASEPHSGLGDVDDNWEHGPLQKRFYREVGAIGK